MGLTGEDKKKYQRDYMRRKRSNKEELAPTGSNIPDWTDNRELDWRKRMQKCNEASHFIPLAKLSDKVKAQLKGVNEEPPDGQEIDSYPKR